MAHNVFFLSPFWLNKQRNDEAVTVQMSLRGGRDVESEKRAELKCASPELFVMRNKRLPTTVFYCELVTEKKNCVNSETVHSTINLRFQRVYLQGKL